MAGNLPILSGRQAVRAFERAGWTMARQRGSHAVLVKPGHIASLSVPLHREIAPGTLRALLRAAELSLDQFRGFL